MYLSPWQLAKFMVWLENELTTAVPVVLLCDFLFWFQNRSGYRLFLSASLLAYTICLIYDFCRLKCPQCKKRVSSGQIAAMKTFRCPHCGCQKF